MDEVQGEDYAGILLSSAPAAAQLLNTTRSCRICFKVANFCPVGIQLQCVDFELRPPGGTNTRTTPIPLKKQRCTNPLVLDYGGGSVDAAEAVLSASCNEALLRVNVVHPQSKGVLNNAKLAVMVTLTADQLHVRFGTTSPVYKLKTRKTRSQRAQSGAAICLTCEIYCHRNYNASDVIAHNCHRSSVPKLQEVAMLVCQVPSQISARNDRVYLKACAKTRTVYAAEFEPSVGMFWSVSHLARVHNFPHLISPIGIFYKRAFKDNPLFLCPEIDDAACGVHLSDSDVGWEIGTDGHIFSEVGFLIADKISGEVCMGNQYDIARWPGSIWSIEPAIFSFELQSSEFIQGPGSIRLTDVVKAKKSWANCGDKTDLPVSGRTTMSVTHEDEFSSYCSLTSTDVTSSSARVSTRVNLRSMQSAMSNWNYEVEDETTSHTDVESGREETTHHGKTSGQSAGLGFLFGLFSFNLGVDENQDTSSGNKTLNSTHNGTGSAHRNGSQHGKEAANEESTEQGIARESGIDARQDVERVQGRATVSRHTVEQRVEIKQEYLIPPRTKATYTIYTTKRSLSVVVRCRYVMIVKLNGTLITDPHLSEVMFRRSVPVATTAVFVGRDIVEMPFTINANTIEEDRHVWNPTPRTDVHCLGWRPTPPFWDGIPRPTVWDGVPRPTVWASYVPRWDGVPSPTSHGLGRRPTSHGLGRRPTSHGWGRSNKGASVVV